MPHLEILAKPDRTKATWSLSELKKVPSLKICTQICQMLLRIASYFPPLACVKIWDLRFVDCANLLLQESKGQTYGLSPVWMRTWVRRLKSKENLLPQPSNVHCWEKAIQYFTPIIMVGKCHTCFIHRDHILLLIHEDGLFIPGYPQHIIFIPHLRRARWVISRPIVANITVYMFPHKQTTLCIQGDTPDKSTTNITFKELQKLSNWWNVWLCWGGWGGDWLSKTAKFQGGKSTNEPSYIICIQDIELKLLRTIILFMLYPFNQN